MSVEPGGMLDAASADYLNQALRGAGVLGDNRVTGVAVESTRAMILSQIRRLRPTYSAPCDAPETLILKTELPERAGRGDLAGRHEVAFYTQIAAAMASPGVPACFGASVPTEPGGWHLLLEDLGDTHVIPTQWPLPPSLTQGRSIVGAHARFQAQWWNDPRLGTTIGTRPGADDLAAKTQRLATQFAAFAGVLGDQLSRHRLRLFERWLEAGPDLLENAFDGANRTIMHGDAHIWNCFLPRNGGGDVRLFDWDSWRIGTGALDLAYMMAVHWYPDLRRDWEPLLLDHYQAMLAASGVAGYDRRALDTDYRRAVLWQLMTPVVQQAYGIPPVIWWNNLQRILLAVDDLGSLEFLK